MFKTKVLTGILLVMAVLFAQVGTAFAAPITQETTLITGTIVEIETQTDENGVTTVLVTVENDLGEEQTYRLSLDTAVGLGLVTANPDTNEVVIVAEPGQAVEIDPTTVIVDEEEGDVHPIAAILASFFEMDAGAVNALHEDGFGFGVIAQALYMAQHLNGDASTADLILQAKRDNDFSDFTLPDGSTPSNWGQFKKALQDNKDKHNLGTIVSGQAENDSEDTTIQEPSTQQDHGNGKNKDKGKNKNKNKNHP